VTGSSASTASSQPRRRAITGRALVLGAVVVLLLVLLASPLNRYFASRSDVGHAAIQLRQDQQALQQLQAQQKLWSDPGYVQQQARQRLMYAMPGDTVYVVVNRGEKSDIEKSAGTVQAAPAGSWNQRLWRSVQVAGG
jgi:cell division protein FtsB